MARNFPVLLGSLPEPAIYARIRDTTPSPLPAVCGADTGSPMRSWRTVADGSSESRDISPSRSRRCASESGTDVPPSLALWPSPGSWSFVTRPQSSCIAPSGWSYLALAEPPAGWLLPVPDSHRRATPPPLPGSPDTGFPRSASRRPVRVSPAGDGTEGWYSRPAPAPAPDRFPQSAAALAIHTAHPPPPDRSG